MPETGSLWRKEGYFSSWFWRPVSPRSADTSRKVPVLFHKLEGQVGLCREVKQERWPHFVITRSHSSQSFSWELIQSVFKNCRVSTLAPYRKYHVGSVDGLPPQSPDPRCGEKACLPVLLTGTHS
jgi:hypothetical protein